MGFKTSIRGWVWDVLRRRFMECAERGGRGGTGRRLGGFSRSGVGVPSMKIKTPFDEIAVLVID